MAGNANFTTDFVTSTYKKYVDRTLRDNIFTSNALMKRIKDKGNYLAFDGGKTLLEPVLYAETNGAKAYSGMEPLDTNSTDISTNAEFTARSYSVPVVISGDDMDYNAGEVQVMNILENRMMGAEETLKGLMNAHMYNTSVGGADGKQLDGIGIMIDSAGTYGNIDPSAAGNSFWAAQEAAYSSDLVGELTDLYLGVAKGGTEYPDLGVTTETVYGDLLDIVDPVLQLQDTRLGNVGFESFKFRAMDVVYDEDCTAQTFYMINTKYTKLRYLTGRDFYMTEMQRPVNQDAMIGHILWKGALTCSARLRQAKLTGISI